MDWDGLFEANADDLIRISWRILGRRADAEDCLQETFVQAFSMSQSKTIHNWPGLLRRIVVMNALAELRKRKTRPSSTLPIDTCEPPCNGESSVDVAIRRELEDRLRFEVAALPDQEASVFCLRYFESLSVSETASTLGISEGAVSAAAHRARRHLEQRMVDVHTMPRK